MYKGIDYEIAVIFAALIVWGVFIICLIDKCKQGIIRRLEGSEKRKYMEKRGLLSARDDQ